MERRRLTVLCLLLGIECGSAGFVGRGITGKGWTGNGPPNAATQQGLLGRGRGTASRCPPSRLRPVDSILGFHHPRSLHKVRKDDNEDRDRNDTSKRKNEGRSRFPSIFADLLNRFQRGEDSKSTAGESKADKRRADAKQKADRKKQQEGSAEVKRSSSWLPRFFGGAGEGNVGGEKAPIAAKKKGSGTIGSTPLRKEQQTTQPRSKELSPPPPSAKGSVSGSGATSSAPPSRKTVVPAGAKPKESPPPPFFNPFLYVQTAAQTAWKNTAAPFFDRSSNGDSAKDEWATVFPTSRIMPGESVPITVRGLDLLIVASLDGRSLYCIANACPHLGTPLETGQLTRLPMEEATTFADTMTTAAAPELVSTAASPQDQVGLILSETQVSEILAQDGCEDCIICPLHRTAFALRSGAVRGSWCPYPPLLGPALGAIKAPTPATTYEVRTRGKNVQVKLVFPPTTKTTK
jgi:nitrite reductase/ring-hydroxylating ferredoxin subunit